MRRLRRRLLTAMPIALAIALFGGTPVRDLSSFALNNRADEVLPRASLSQDLALAAPIDPVIGNGLTPAVAALNAGPRPAETPIRRAPTRFHGEAPKADPPAALSDGPVSSQSARREGTWAVVIGVNDYPGNDNDLHSAVNDANDVVEALRTLSVPDDHVLVLRDGQVNNRTLLQSVSWLASYAGSEAVAGFFFAGHVRKSARGGEEIVTSDGSAVSDNELANALNRVPATRSWVAIAACYGGGFDEVLRPGRVLTAAAGRDSLAYENSAIDRSYMVEYMVRRGIIQGRASDTVQTAFSYAVDRISRDHPGREPVQIDESNGALDLRPPNANRAAEPKSDAEPQAQPQPEPEPQPANPPAEEPPASDRPPTNGTQHCYTKGLVRHCSG